MVILKHLSEVDTLFNMRKYFFPIFFCWLLLITPGFVRADEVADDMAQQQQLQQQLQEVETQIAELQQQLTTTQGEKKTLANKIKQLSTQQRNLRLQIQATTLRLQAVQKKLATTERSITANESREEKLRYELLLLLKVLRQQDEENFLFYLVQPNGLNTLFEEVSNYQQLVFNINSVVNDTKIVHQQLEVQQADYTEQQSDTQQLLSLHVIEQTALTGKLQEQSQVLEETQGREANYQILLQNNKKRAAQIKSRLYELLGVSQQINFGQAVTIAQWVSAQTGVSPAFLLAILTQESNLGKNVGTCNRPGDPPEKSWKVIMKPERDQGPFQTITTALGRDPDITPVSCPMHDAKGKQIGWGGAMGPAQFIPSTWIGYQNKVSALTGKNPADPWDIRDAFAGAALLLKANGADASTDGQWKAAMRYFSGSTNTRYRFYGDNVMTLAAKYEEDIKNLTP